MINFAAAVVAAIALSGPRPATFKDVAGAVHSVPEAGKKATVLFFIGTDCPISNRLAPEMSRIVQDYGSKGIAFLFVYPDKTTAPADVKTHLQSFSLPLTGVIDGAHRLVKLGKASVTPETAVVLPTGALAYRGRINDLYIEHNRPSKTTSRNDLRIALDEVLAGKPVSKPFLPAVGCVIPD